MKIKKDLKNFIDESCESRVQCHIEGCYGRYIGMPIKEAAYEFDSTFSWHDEIYDIEETLLRKLSIDEKKLIFKKYLKLFKDNFYESMKEGYRLSSYYYYQQK